MFSFKLEFYIFIIFVIEICKSQPQQQQSKKQKISDQFTSSAPILDIDDEKTGYIGTIGERNVLVDLKPHLQIRNIDQINGICSYHVFKPNNEEFPFTIDIKDKTTGEAVIEVLKKDLNINKLEEDNFYNYEQYKKENKFILLDCNKRKEFSFLIQAHDCSIPSLASNKVSVKIQVLDHDDYKLNFEKDFYKIKLATSSIFYEDIIQIRARDKDCTNDGYACSYQLVSNDDSVILDEKYPFKIDSDGRLSTSQPLTKSEVYDFKVKAFDCLNNSSFIDVPVEVEIIESCTPQWNNVDNQITTSNEQTTLFNKLHLNQCDFLQDDLVKNPDSMCEIEEVNANLKLVLDVNIKNECKLPVGCDSGKVVSKQTLFSGQSDVTLRTEDENDLEDINLNVDDNDEKSSEDEKKINKNRKIFDQLFNFRTFSKENENALKVNFDGNFGNFFILSVWLRRSGKADKQTKEQVICGTDSMSMNRHHFGLYFYRGNIKFLMRKESESHSSMSSLQPESNQIKSESNEKFYPSLWQWALYEPLLNDSQWHFYEIKLNYPKASLYIDGVLFAENLTNSDIIDAYELKSNTNSQNITTYIGACYHARTKSLVDHFEGDIGPLKLYKIRSSINTIQSNLTRIESECQQICNEAIQLASQENGKKGSVKSINSNEITIQTADLTELNELLVKVNYYIKNTKRPQIGSRKVVLNTTIKCNGNKNINMNIVDVNINFKSTHKEYKVEIKGDKSISALKSQVENGIKPFGKISIDKTLVDSDNNDETESEEQVDKIYLESCQIHIYPELLANKNLNEKFTYDPALLDQFKLEFKDASDVVYINGLQQIKNYELFLQNLLYQVNEVSLMDVASSNEKNKQFHLSCVCNDPYFETNTIIIQLNITWSNEAITNHQLYQGSKYVALKRQNRLFASDSDDEIIKRTDYKVNKSNEMSTSLIIALIVMCSCAMGFLLIFGAMRLHSAGVFGIKKKNFINEENPQMEWDDSGLNITENPLNLFEANKNYNTERGIISLEDDEDYTSYDEQEDDDDEDEDTEHNEEYDHYHSDDEYQEKMNEKDLEWDDTSIEIKEKQQKLSSNKKLSSKHFV